MKEKLTSRFVYVYKDKFRGTIWGATNMRTLARKSGISYNKLRWWFARQNRVTMEFDAFRIDRLPVSMIFNKCDPQ